MLDRILDAPSSPGWQFLVDDRGAPRLINGCSPDGDTTTDQQLWPETWAYTVRGDTSFNMRDLGYKYGIAQCFATGRSRRLRDFIGGAYSISEGQIPVTRTVCGPPVLVDNNTRSLPFPILAPDHKWRNVPFGPNQDWGPLADVELSDLQHRELASSQARAKWVTLNSTLGAATAGLAFVSQNSTTTIGIGCTIDSRWALGQTFRSDSSPFLSFDVHIGKPVKPVGNSYAGYKPQDFFDAKITPSYGQTIKADQDWLDSISPLYSIASSDEDGYNMTTFEALLDATYLSSPAIFAYDQASSMLTGQGSSILTLE
jgi:hypothetical protein